MTEQLLIFPVRPGTTTEGQSGLRTRRPVIYARLADQGTGRKTAYVLSHPARDVLDHWLIEPLQRRGRTVLAVNTRFAGDDSNLIMERAIQDIGVAVRHLRDAGYQRVVLIGSSGGAALAAFYQAEAEQVTVWNTPDGLPIVLDPEEMPKADAIALLAAHPGRAYVMSEWLDPAVLREDDLLCTNPALDMYLPENGPPYDDVWLDRFRAAQVARNEWLTDFALGRLRQFAHDNIHADDEAFVIHRTMADPRFLDPDLDPSDREPGTPWGDPRALNYAPGAIGRFSTLRSFLSQWSLRTSRADGPACLARTSVPVLNVELGSDQLVFPSQTAAWAAAVGDRATAFRLKGANHYPSPDLVEELADNLVDWGG